MSARLITLEPFTAADIDRLLGWISSPRILNQWVASGFSYPLTRAQIEDHMQEATNGSRLIFKALDLDHSVVGHVELGRIDRFHRSLRVGRVFIDPAHRGRGVGTQLMQAALSVAFDQLQMHRVELSVFDFNHAAISCYERVGFRREGTLREMHRFADEYWSEIIMGILETERIPYADPK